MPADTFESSALPHLSAVERFAEFLTREHSAAEDLVQETYLRALRGWHTFLPGSDARKWLFTICRNTFLRWCQQRRSLVACGDVDVDALPMALSHRHEVYQESDDLVDRIDVGPAIKRAIAELAEPHRTILLLIDLEGHAYQEAAAILEVPIGTVRSRLFRARRMIQGSLSAYAEDAGLTHTHDAHVNGAGPNGSRKGPPQRAFPNRQRIGFPETTNRTDSAAPDHLAFGLILPPR